MKTQQLHTYSAAYCQHSTQIAPASSKPLHLHAEALASNMLCLKNCTWLALHNVGDHSVNQLLVLVPTRTSICSLCIIRSDPLCDWW